MSFRVAEGRRSKLRFLIDTGAHISICKESSLQPGVKYDSSDKVTIKGISTATLQTLGSLDLQLETEDMYTVHKFQIVSDCIAIPFDAILGRDFWDAKKAKLDFENRVIQMGTLEVMFDEHGAEMRMYITLPPRSETLVEVPTSCDANLLGVIAKEELLPGVYMAETLTKSVNGRCVVSILNTLDTGVSMQTPEVQLEPYEAGWEENVRSAIEDNDELRRIKLLSQRLRLDHLSTGDREAILDVCNQYHDIFYLPGDKLSCTQTIEHSIPTPTIDKTRGINVRQYRIPDILKSEVDKQTDQMLREGIITHSMSPWNSPIIMVPKKMDASGKQKWRMVVDYRNLNQVTIGDSFPLPLITDIVDSLGSAKFFSTLDCAMGYYQIPLNPEDQPKTAFSTHRGHFHYRRMPMGLKGAPATFQRLMNYIMSGIQGVRALIYLDDIIVYGTTAQEHNDRLTEVFDRLRQHHLKLHVDKCEFLRDCVTYLGYVISKDGLLPDETKVVAVRNFPTPQTRKELKGFLGLTGYYRRFIADYSKIAKPLFYLTKKGVSYEWKEPQEVAFNKLKELLTNAPLLQYPNFSKPFILCTDASATAVGAILSQGNIGNDKPVAYASKALTKAELAYSVIEKEFYAIVWACTHFRPYLYGRPFLIITDHQPLSWISSVKNPSSRLLKWRLRLEEFDYQIMYRRGMLNSGPDALSRVQVTLPTGKDTEVPKELSQEQKYAILREAHATPLGAHMGMNRTYHKLKLYTDWPGMKKDVEEYIQKCESCQKNKITQVTTKLPLQLTTTPDTIMQKVNIDVVGPINVSANQNRCILTMQDDLTKYLVAVPMQDQTAETIARHFVENLVLIYGCPQILLSDCGANFLSELFKNICKLLHVQKINTTAVHPMTNGSLERTHRVLVEFIRHFVNQDQTNWDEWVKYAVFAYNTTPHSATGFTPFELMFGRIANLPGYLQKPPECVNYNLDSYVQELKQRLQHSYAIAKERLETAKRKSKDYYDKQIHIPKFQVGDLVLLQHESPRKNRSRKLGPSWIGPYTIRDIKGVNVTLQLRRGKQTTVHANRLKPFFV